AEVALRDADVRVVDVAVDDVRDDVAGILARANGVGEPAKERRRRGAVQLQRLVGADARARANLVSESGDARHDKSAAFRRTTRGRAPRRTGKTSGDPRALRRRGSTEY